MMAYRGFAPHLKLTDALKQRMNQKRQWQLDQYRRPQSCYQRTVVFEFLPDGRAYVWLHGCSYYDYLTTLAHYGETRHRCSGIEFCTSTLALYGETLFEEGAYTQDNQLPNWLQKTKAKFGVAQLFLMPWDKLGCIDPWTLQKKPNPNNWIILAIR